jgi:sterol-4alpha-carboxylate 3-dehydrogenase (decarboxylating)
MNEKIEKAPTGLPSVLIVGGNGFLGKTMPTLIAARHPNCDIHVVDIAPSASASAHFTYHQGDVTNLTSLIDIFQQAKPSAVIHSASPPIPVRGTGDEKLFYRVNVEGTRNVIRACEEAGVKALVYTSSASVVYNGRDLVNANEDTPYATRHVDPYNESKVQAADSL